jgi:hypothetical protein
MDGLKLLEWKKEIENQLESTKYTYDPEISISGDNIIIDMSGVARIGRVVVRYNKGVECEIRRIAESEMRNRCLFSMVQLIWNRILCS